MGRSLIHKGYLQIGGERIKKRRYNTKSYYRKNRSKRRGRQRGGSAALLPMVEAPIVTNLAQGLLNKIF